MHADNNTESTTERQEIDPVFKDALTKNFEALNLSVQTQVERSEIPSIGDDVRLSEAKSRSIGVGGDRGRALQKHRSSACSPVGV